MGLWVNSHYFIQIAINYKDYAMRAPNVNDLNEGDLAVFILSTPANTLQIWSLNCFLAVITNIYHASSLPVSLLRSESKSHTLFVSFLF
jgi:hypothetical protein